MAEVKFNQTKLFLTYRGYTNYIGDERNILEMGDDESNIDAIEYIENEYEANGGRGYHVLQEMYEMAGINFPSSVSVDFTYSNIYVRPDDTLSVVFYVPDKFTTDTKKKLLEMLVKLMNKYDISELVFIYKSVITNSVKNWVNELRSLNAPYYQTMSYKFLTFLVVEHVQSPKYMVISDEEREILSKRWDVDLGFNADEDEYTRTKNISIMRTYDPVTVQLGFKYNDLLRLIDEDPDADQPIHTKISYRLVR